MTSEKVKKQIDKLLDDFKSLIKLSEEEKDFYDFTSKYQNWYSKALKVVSLLGNDRLEEFKGYYLIDPKRKHTNFGNYSIQDYIRGVGASLQYAGGPPNFDHHEAIVIKLIAQRNILASLQSRIDSVLSDIEGKLFSEIQDEELESAKKLVRINVRAAGTIAGVILEKHLQRVAANHGVKIRKKNPTISDLNDPLKKQEVYEMQTWRKIQYLGDLRNLCSHNKDREPTKEEVEELIEGVNRIIKNIF